MEHASTTPLAIERDEISLAKSAVIGVLAGIVVWGILGIFWVLARLLFQGDSATDYSGLEALASYWHATDIIWLIIFPLFYVLA